MKIGILTMEVYETRTPDSVGSSRIRGTWLLKYWPEAELFKIGQAYDVVIYQKAFFVEHMKLFKGIKILDLCDPDWIDGKPVKECIELCDAVTCSSERLVDFVKTMTDKPVFFVPDRVDLSVHPFNKKHEGRARSVVWYGYHGNHKVLDQCLSSLKRLGLKLTIISDLPYITNQNVQGIDDAWIMENLKNIKYDQESFAEELCYNGDMVLNPRIESGKYQFKSNNKTYIAWALGMPVAKDSEDLERFMDPDERTKEAAARRKEVEDLYRTERSVEEYKNIIDQISHAKL
jgi:hypothetical protein